MGLQYRGGVGGGEGGQLKQRIHRTSSEHTMYPSRDHNSRSKSGTNVWSNALDVYL